MDEWAGAADIVVYALITGKKSFELISFLGFWIKNLISRFFTLQLFIEKFEFNCKPYIGNSYGKVRTPGPKVLQDFFPSVAKHATNGMVKKKENVALFFSPLSFIDID